jgi:hypothetical protein
MGMPFISVALMEPEPVASTEPPEPTVMDAVVLTPVEILLNPVAKSPVAEMVTSPELSAMRVILVPSTRFKTSCTGFSTPFVLIVTPEPLCGNIDESSCPSDPSMGIAPASAVPEEVDTTFARHSFHTCEALSIRFRRMLQRVAIN